MRSIESLVSIDIVPAEFLMVYNNFVKNVEINID